MQISSRRWSKRYFANTRVQASCGGYPNAGLQVRRSRGRDAFRHHQVRPACRGTHPASMSDNVSGRALQFERIASAAVFTMADGDLVPNRPSAAWMLPGTRLYRYCRGSYLERANPTSPSRRAIAAVRLAEAVGKWERRRAATPRLAPTPSSSAWPRSTRISAAAPTARSQHSTNWRRRTKPAPCSRHFLRAARTGRNSPHRAHLSLTPIVEFRFLQIGILLARFSPAG